MKMADLEVLKEIISVTESIIKDQNMIKEMAETLLQDGLQSEAKHQELNTLLSQSKHELLTEDPNHIEKINILAEEVNDIKAEEKRTFHKLKSLQDQVCLKTASQGTLLNKTKGEKSKQYDDTCLVNCRNNTESSKRLIDEHSNMPQDNGSIDQPYPLGFDDLVCYFETGSSCGQALWETSLIQGGKQQARQEGQEHTIKLYTGELLYFKR